MMIWKRQDWEGLDGQLADCKGLPAACPPDRVDALLCADAATHFFSLFLF